MQLRSPVARYLGQGRFKVSGTAELSTPQIVLVGNNTQFPQKSFT
jgi:hypothetical protein